jgi:hypothetical protein
LKEVERTVERLGQVLTRALDAPDPTDTPGARASRAP